MSLNNRRKLVEVAKVVCRELRKNSTEVERKLWETVRAKKLGKKFCRQFPLFHDITGRETFFVTDFYCYEEKLIIELDGKYHQYRLKEDKAKKMKLVKKILLYEIHNTIRSKWVILYTFFFFLVGYGLFTFSGDVNKAYISLMNIIIIVIPLVSIVFGSIYFYNSREFIEMMLSQPIDRKSLFLGIYLGTAIPLSAGFALGFSIPFILFGKVSEQIDGFILLLLIGVLLTFIFIALSFLISVKQDDKSKGLGLAILIWLVLAVVYDGFVLLIIYNFQDYPLENAMIILSALNPIDLGRILFLMKFDIAALMGYTGAVFQRFFGSSSGMIISVICLLFWIIVPFLLSSRFFKKKDF